MTLNDIFERLYAIDRAAQELLSEAGFTCDDGLPAQVRPKPDNPDDLFLKDKAQDLLEPFETLHEELLYLRAPAHGEYTLQLFPNGRYGYYDKDGRVHIFTCGKTLEAKIHDSYGRQHWVCTRIEHDGSDYFLWGHGSVPLSGLTIRERW